VPGVLVDRVASAIEAGAAELFRRQRPDGAFTDAAPASILGTAGSIVALHTADPAGSAELIERGAGWLRGVQQPDGGWGGVAGAGSELVPTAVAAAALRIVDGGSPARAGTPTGNPTGNPDGTADGTVDAAVDAAVAGGLRRLRELGGVSVIGDRAIAHLCRQFLAMAGLPGGERVRRLPIEVVLFDGVRRRRISFRTAPFVGLALLQTATMPAGPLRRRTIRGAVPRALALLERIHEHEGRTGAFSEDPWPAALVCLGLARAGLAPHLVEAITGFLRRSVRADGSWDAVANLDLTRSAFAATGLVAAGYGADQRLIATREMFRRCRQLAPFEVFGCPAGGWSFSGARGWPVTLESAEILAALAGMPGRDGDPSLRAGLDWLVGRQDSAGSWSLWVRDTKLPNDGPCPGITSQGIAALVEAGHDRQSRPVAAAARWLLDHQRPDGTYHNLWYRDFTSGTAMALDGLAAAGHGTHPAALRSRDWLLRTQHADGSWGTGDGGGADSGGDGSVEETAWAVHALIAAGAPDGEPVRRGVEWLLDAQRADGSWRPSRVCAYIRHYLYYPNGAITHGLALRALGAYRTATTGTTTPEARL